MYNLNVNSNLTYVYGYEIKTSSSKVVIMKKSNGPLV